MSLKVHAHVVENHDEALPVLYRAIGSKLLPLEDSILLHFDSHPDMLLPRDLLASDVYDKHRLFELVSIENWILPAMFAGHFSTLVWVKPPWSEQMCEGYSQFYIGRHEQTSKVRVTSKMPYFVGETLYCHENELLDKRLISLYVIDINSWRKLLKVPADKQVPLIVRQHSHTQTTQVCDSDCKLSNCSCIQKRSFEQVTTNVCGDPLTQASKKLKFEESNISDSKSEGEICSLEKSPVTKDANPSDVFKVKQILEEYEAKLKSEQHDDSFYESCSSEEVNDDINLHETEDSLIGEDTKTGPKYCHFLHTPEWLTLLSLLSKKPYVLDIDLDFFSTMDPFTLQFTAHQYKLLKKLYTFEKPSDNSDEGMAVCVATREKQLGELKSIFTAIQCEKEVSFGNEEREKIIKELIQSLATDPPQGIVTVDMAPKPAKETEASRNKTPDEDSPSKNKAASSNSSENKCTGNSTSNIIADKIREILQLNDKIVNIDFDWLHEIGCGCDDTELPHHVSSDSEIEDLICGVEDVIGTLPEPKIITIARSCEDDYCPKFQVERIQQLTLHMVKRLYQQCRVTLEYMIDSSP